MPKRLLCSIAVALGFVVALFVAVPASASLPPVSFSAPTTYESSGPFPFTVAIADLNGDAKPDVVVVNSSSSTAAVLLGNGGGGFGPATTYPIGGAFSYSIATGDLNGDGNPDVVVTNINSNTVSVLLGDGLGGLGAPTTYSTGTSLDLAPTSVAIGDINGDDAERPSPAGLVLETHSFYWMSESPTRGAWRMEPVLIPPFLYKNFREHPFPAVWEQALRTLSECETLVIVGYSFPPTDFRTRRLFLEAFSQHKLKSLVIVNPDPAVAGTARQLTHFNGAIVSCDDLRALYGLPATWFEAVEPALGSSS
jgi:hypothetical protein